jgi:hypothetical protein
MLHPVVSESYAVKKANTTPDNHSSLVRKGWKFPFNPRISRGSRKSKSGAVSFVGLKKSKPRIPEDLTSDLPWRSKSETMKNVR